MADSKYFRIQMNNATVANGKKTWLQLNMHNDKNVRFIEKWKVKLLTEEKKRLLFNAWTKLPVSSKVIKATEYLWDTVASKKQHHGIWHKLINM